ncbi:hypothetical protein Desdi_2272 [Desulfitobacterium dichloroeliminans LMG P-21439]|uniref:DUF4363 family protein n=1 Tax=Desulfitobacterium dichloroeliminans (strain LMG P-21439 / DCA1) TaxID=871963 RepID=L0F922_DESDL|nr:DUF4363 family protein [Desulfitobacterium dichloroeliminans]AGA69702.1 hypothetical protein Desdi_2272 [Desulfitobacterium dichloroeliminans LMG P-21439]
MLRTYLTVGIIILVLVLGSYWHNQYINSSASSLEGMLIAVEDIIQNRHWGNANQQMDQLKKEWDETKKLWSILLDHQEIDTIDLSLKRAEKYILEQEAALSLGEVAALRLLFHHIADTETITLQNIL